MPELFERDETDDGCDACGAAHWTACRCDPRHPFRRAPTAVEREAGRALRAGDVELAEALYRVAAEGAS